MEPPPKKTMITRPRQLSAIQESIDPPVDRQALNQGTSFLLNSPPAIHSVPSASQTLTFNSISCKFPQLRANTMRSSNPSNPFSDRIRPLTPINPNIMTSSIPAGPTSAPLSLSQHNTPSLITSPTISESGRSSPAFHLRPASAQSLNYRQATTGSPSSVSRRGRQRMREVAPNSRSASASVSVTPITSGQRTPLSYPNKASVKHLTCYWWKEKGQCKFAEPECLYSHHDTGVYADAPKQVTPGEPAMAGKKLERALKNLDTQSRSQHMRSDSNLANIESASTYNLRPNTPARHSEEGGVFRSNVGYMTYTDEQITQLEDDVVLFRGLVEQNSKQNAVLVTTIEILQAENKDLKATTSTLSLSNAQLTEERDILRNMVNQFSANQNRTVSAPNPFGIIGRLGRSSGGSSGGSNGGVRLDQ